MGLKNFTKKHIVAPLARRVGYTGNPDYLQDAFPHITDFVGSSNNTAMKLGAAWACVRILSEVPASLPIMVYRDGDRGAKIQDKNHSVYKLLHNPSPYMSGYTFVQVFLAHAQTTGNGVGLIQRDEFTGEATRLLPIPWADCVLSKKNGELFYKITNTTFDINDTYPADDVLHMKLFSDDGITGRSPIAYARTTMSNGHHEQNFENTFWNKGGIAKNVIETDKQMPTGDALKEYKRAYKELHEGITGNHSTVLMDNGKKLKQLQLLVPDANFISLKAFTVEDVCRFFGLHSHMVNHLVGANYNTLEQQNIAYVQKRLRPDVKNLETECERKLFAKPEQGSTHVKVILDGLLRGDMRATKDVVHTYVTDGIMSHNEARTIYLGMNPTDEAWMDTPIKPAHLMGKEQANNNSNDNGNKE